VVRLRDEIEFPSSIRDAPQQPSVQPMIFILVIAKDRLQSWKGFLGDLSQYVWSREAVIQVCCCDNGHNQQTERKPSFASLSWLAQSGAFSCDILYTGYRFESGTGLFHIRQRAYHCSGGRGFSGTLFRT
jgi:hypothetical protein